MKKAILTFGLFSLMMVLTSFTSPSEIGGQTIPGEPGPLKVTGQQIPADLNPLQIGNQYTVQLHNEIGGQTIPGEPGPLK